jgi:hypothetical protein
VKEISNILVSVDKFFVFKSFIPEVELCLGKKIFLSHLYLYRQLDIIQRFVRHYKWKKIGDIGKMTETVIHTVGTVTNAVN